jgi:Kef-type K+ transport system membrane component KefB
MESSFPFELAIIVGSALILSLFAWKLRIPKALGQLIAGMFIGPFGFRFITDITMIEIGREKGEAKEAVLHHEFLLEIGRDLRNFFTA